MIIYTDGSAHPNPGPGGYGVVILDNNENLLYNYSRQYKREKVTNNEMEIKAILYSFLNYGVNINNPLLGFNNCAIPIVYSDSNYCVQTFNTWMFSWAKNNWIKSDKKQPENLELIKAYYDWYQKGYRIDLRKVKGHSDNKWNQMADDLATGKIKGMNNNE
jgi:ribonuclease HI